MKKLLLIFFCSVFFNSIQAQIANVRLDNDLLWRYQSALNETGNGFHTSIKPYLYFDLQNVIKLETIDSSYIGYLPKHENYLTRKLFREHLVTFDKDLLHFTLDPILNIQFGKEFLYNNTGHLNTRGFLLQGSIGRNFYFNTGFYEDDIKPILYQTNYIVTHGVVPGYGTARYIIGISGRYDYGMAFGTLTYKPNHWLTLQAGHDKNFIGDGYRSLLFSDFAYNYPYFKAIFTFGKWKYQYLLTQMQYISPKTRYEDAFLTKNATINYLSWNTSEWLSIGIFNSTVWYIDTLSGLALKDANYFTPVPFSQALYSPRQQTIICGLNLKIRPSKSFAIYGQFVADDPSIRQFSEPQDWYANKTGYQIGAKYFNVFSIKGLHAQIEYNCLRPYTYTTNKTVVPPLSYTHYNEPMAHPLGANFKEIVNIIRYHYKSFYAENKFIYAVKGDNSGNLNYGGDIFMKSNIIAEYGNITTQGVKNTVIYNDFRIGYLINPRNELKLEIGFNHRQQESNFLILKESYLYLGLKMCMSNTYFDF